MSTVVSLKELSKRVVMTGATTLTSKDTEALLKVTVEEIRAALKAGESVKLGDLGTVVVTRREARQARNPQTGGTVLVEAKNIAKVKVSKPFIESLN